MDPLKYAEQIAYSSKEVLKFSYDQAVKYKDKPGVYVECGVAAGAQIIAMAAGAPNKTIYAFDSFKGIPLPSNKDDQMPGIKFLTKTEQMCLPNPGEQALVSSGATSVSIDSFYEHLRNALGDISNIYAVPGWFEDTVPVFAKEMELPPPEEISILRLDGDLYNSTYIALKYLYPKVIKGGVCIVDDAALPGCWNALVDYFDVEDFPKMEFITDSNSKVAWWIK